MKNSHCRKSSLERYFSRDGVEERWDKYLTLARRLLIGVFVSGIVGWYGTKAGYALWEAVHPAVSSF